MTKKLNFVIHFTYEDDDNTIHRAEIESENEKFAIKKFERKYPKCYIMSISKL